MDIIQEDDIVILHETFKKVDFIRVKAGQVYQNKFGAFHHNDMIGSPYGSKLVARKSNGHLYLLAPTPELWSKALPHRTQIVFTSDAASIVFNLQLKPGCKVGEAGTGSGSLSTAFMRTIAPTGYLYTFEFNQTRAEKAALEFQQNGISDFVKVEHRDVCENGFPEGLELDAVFLDLPKPWVAVPYADKVLKKQGRIASYSPCLEQVQRTCKALQENGFSRIRTIETRQIPYDARKVSLPIPSFGTLFPLVHTILYILVRSGYGQGTGE